MFVYLLDALSLLSLSVCLRLLPLPSPLLPDLHQLGGGDAPELDEAGIEPLEHEEHGVCSPDFRETAPRHPRQALEVEAGPYDAPPKKSDGVGPIVPLNVLCDPLLHEGYVIANGAPSHEILRPIDLSGEPLLPPAERYHAPPALYFRIKIVMKPRDP